MKKRENIVRFTLDEMLEMDRIGATGTDWERVKSMDETEIERLAIADLNDLGIPHDWYENARPVTRQTPVVSVAGDIPSGEALLEGDQTQGSVIVLRTLGQHYHQIMGTGRFVRVTTRGSTALKTA